MKEYNTIVLHCSATPPSMDIGKIVIDKWHRARGWSQIGYHYVIRRCGKIEQARPVYIHGAHTKGHNRNTIGVCYIGGVDENNKPENNITGEQKQSFKRLTEALRLTFGTLNIKGHRDFKGVKKSCPSFDVCEVFGYDFCNE